MLLAVEGSMMIGDPIKATMVEVGVCRNSSQAKLISGESLT